MSAARSAQTRVEPKRRGALERARQIFATVGPGIVAGAADDDPSGIATYSIAGAQFGTSLLWLAPLTWPLIAVIQMMCARIGMVTGRGLAGALRAKFPRWALVIVGICLFVANTINVAADLAGMADAASLLTGWSSHFYVVLLGVGIGAATLWLPYRRLAGALKWLAISLFAYVVTAFSVHVHWSRVIHDSFIPSLPRGNEALATVVAILGTTISPYLFFWQASLEVEEEKCIGRTRLRARLGATADELGARRWDVGAGTLFSNLIMFFIIVTTAATLHAHGDTKIETSRQAAEALRPFAGNFAAALYTIGLIGVGVLAIPTLTGSSAYALAETLGWRSGLSERPGHARKFYAIVVLSTVVGIALDFAHVSPIRALFLSAVLNGLLAPVVLIGVVLVARDPVLMQGQPSSRPSLAVVAFAVVIMVAAAVGMFVL